MHRIEAVAYGSRAILDNVIQSGRFLERNVVYMGSSLNWGPF